MKTNMEWIPKRSIFLMTLLTILVMMLSNVSFAANTNTFTFSDTGITAKDKNENGYEIEKTSLTINEAGTYTIKGSCGEGSIKVKKETTGVTLILKDLTLACSTTAPISLNKTTETTIDVQGSVTLVDKEDVATEETNADFEGACIKVKAGATLNIKGDGTLNIDGSACKNGIKGGVTSKITVDGNVKFNINVANSGLAADGSMIINGGIFNVTAEDAIKCDPDDEDTESLGDLTINGGSFTIKSSSDGVRGNGKLEINGGTFDITTGEGLEATYVLINDGTINISATDDGINASNKTTRYSPKIEINGGNITINMGKGDTDAIDSNGELIITGGKLNITAQSAFDYDTKVTFTGGDVTVNGQKITTISNSMIMGGRKQGGMNNQNGAPMNPQNFNKQNAIQGNPPQMPSGEFRQNRGRGGNQRNYPLNFQNDFKWSKASNWAVEELNKAGEKNLIPESFANGDLTTDITRQEFAHVIIKLYEALTRQKVSNVTNNPFTDTNDSEVLKAYSLDITNGTSDNTFTPNAKITREQMATMFMRAISKAGNDTTIDLEKVAKYSDDSEMHDWGRRAIYYLSNNDIINGTGDNIFGVAGNATKEQALLISERAETTLNLTK